MTVVSAVPVATDTGALLREWRRIRNVSQFDLARMSAVSTRHLSFIETGRARPSREMILHLADKLDVPLRDRNKMLLGSGYAPAFGERPLHALELAPVRAALERFLLVHEPYPAMVVDKHWDIVDFNRGVRWMTRGVAAELLTPPANALRIALHPDGMAPRVRNIAEWRRHLLGRLRREVTLSGDPTSADLLAELETYGSPDETDRVETFFAPPLLFHEVSFDGGELALFSTVTTFGTARDVTVADLAIEAFYPADEGTARALADGVAEIKSKESRQRPLEGG